MSIRRKPVSDHPYTLLNEHLLHKVQELAGQRWTDFNAHDPGVTIMDVWAYGLFDLQYRLALDFGSFLPHDDQGRIDFAKLGLHNGEALFAASVVTAADQERLVVEQIAGVTDCRITMENGGHVVEVVAGNGHQAGQLEAQVRTFFRQKRLLGQLMRHVRVVASIERDRITVADPMAGFTSGAPIAETHVHLPEKPFRSMQFDMPQLYGLSAEGMPNRLDSQHEAAILQLKAYMLLADYLLSSADQQLRAIPPLIGKMPYQPPTFTADVDIPELDHILDDDKRRQAVIFDDKGMSEQRLAFAKWRCASYGEAVEPTLALLRYGYPEDQLADAFFRITERLPLWQQRRMRGMDLDGHTALPIKGYFNALLNLEPDEERPLGVRLEGLSVRLLDDDAFAKRFNLDPMLVAAPKGSRVFKIKHIALPDERWSEQECAKYVGLIKQGFLFESYLQAGTELEHYRLIEHNGRYTLCLVLASQKQWVGIMESPSGSRMVELANALQRYLRYFRSRYYACYVIEHALLLNERGLPPEDQLTISVALPAAWQGIQGKAWLENWWKQRLPAHMLVRFTWLSVKQMEAMDVEYFRWKEGWRTSQVAAVIQGSTLLRRYL